MSKNKKADECGDTQSARLNIYELDINIIGHAKEPSFGYRALLRQGGLIDD
jgi:hypothetical protein